MMSSLRIALLLVAVFSSTLLMGQWNYPEFNMSNATIGNCFGRLYDSGGLTGPYGVDENTTTVINTDGIITMTFFGSFALQDNVDFLTVYDGASTAGLLLGTFTGQVSPGELVATSGAMTLVLTSDGSISTAGFSAYWRTQVPDPIPPSLSVQTIPSCNAAQVNINLSDLIECDWLESATFEVLSSAETFEVTQVESNCAAGMTDIITLYLDHAFTFNCNIQVNMTITIPDECNGPHEFELGTSFLFANCGINADLIADSPAVCPGECTNLQVITEGCFNYAFEWGNGIGSGGGLQNVCPTAATTYTVVITELETSLEVTKSVTVGIENVTIFTADQTVCQSVPNILLQAGTEGTWSGPGVIPGTNFYDPDLAGGGAHTVYFNSTNCVDSMEFTVIPISAQFAVAACPGSAPFQVNGAPAGGLWSGLDIDITPGGVIDPVASGNYQVVYSVNGCTDITLVNIDSISEPFILDPLCQSVNLDTLEFSPLGGFWTGPGIVSSFNGTIAPANAPPGDVTLQYTINGCQADFSIFIKEVGVIEEAEICPLEAPFIVDPNPVPVGGFWASPDGAISNANTGLFNPAAFTADTETYITYQAINGCVDTVAISMVRTNIAKTEVSFCVTDTETELDTALTGILTPSGGSWYGPGINGSSTTGFTVNPQGIPVGLNYIYYITNGCTDSMLVRNFAPNLPDLPQQFCTTDSPVILANAVPGGIWSGAGIINEETGLFDPSVAGEGSYYVYWDNPSGCKDSIFVTIEKQVEPLITGIQPQYCTQDYEVAFITTPFGGLLSGSLAQTTFNPSLLGEGEYEVIYKVIPDICPEVSDTANFVVYPPIALQPLTTTVNPVCYEETSTIAAVVTGGFPENDLTYAWSNGGPNAATNSSIYTETTMVTLLVDDGCSTPQVDSIEIEIYPRFQYVAFTSDTLCPGEDGFIDLTITPNDTYLVTWNGDTGNPGYYEDDAGTSVEISITDDNGCQRDTIVDIPAFSAPNAAFTVTPEDACIAFEDIGNIAFQDSSSNAVTGTWYFGDGTTAELTPGEEIPHLYDNAGLYTIGLTVVNEGECTDSTSFELCILPPDPVFVPDIFSPNDDGKNDTLYVRGLLISRLEFRVYNRWGEVVFETNSPSKGWDGQLRGAPAPSGSYYYTLSASIGSATRVERVGEVVLVR
jgi:gliding motility-associated-like protein